MFIVLSRPIKKKSPMKIEVIEDDPKKYQKKRPKKLKKIEPNNPSPKKKQHVLTSKPSSCPEFISDWSKVTEIPLKSF